MKKGITSIVVVSMVAILMMFLVVMWQARILLYIQRNQGLSDMLAATYSAESQIYDAIVRFMGGYNLPTSGVQTLADGTKMKLEVTTVGNTQKLNVNTTRQFATLRLEVSKTKTESETSGYKEVEIILQTDCTASMEDAATESCMTKCCGSASKCERDSIYRSCLAANNCTTRLQELKKAATKFVDKVADFQVNNPTKTVKLGWGVFRVDAKMLTADNVTEDINQVKEDIVNKITDWHESSEACKETWGTTSVGSGFEVANAYYQSVPAVEDKKRVVVLISDGEPNSRHASYTGKCPAASDPQQCTSGQTGCSQKAVDFMECSVKTVSNGGSRPDDVDAYAVTVLDKPPHAVTDILERNATKYYNSADATKLGDILEDIFKNIVESTEEIKIQKIMPGLSPTP